MILDGSLIAIDRLRHQRPYYSGKHQRHGVNVQLLADPAGRLIWASPMLPGSTHDLIAARRHGLIAALTSAAIALTAILTLHHTRDQAKKGSIWYSGKSTTLQPQSWIVVD